MRGIAQELVERIAARGGTAAEPHRPNYAGIGGSFTPVDPDVMKLVLLDLAEEAGVELRLHTVMVDALTDGRSGDRRIGPQQVRATAAVRRRS